MRDDPIIEAMAVRSARALLQWSQAELARRAGVAVSTLAEFEKGERIPIANNLRSIREALEQAGIEFGREGAGVFVLSLYFLSSAGGAELRFQYTPEAKGNVDELLGLFGSFDGVKHTLAAEQKATPELKTALAAIAHRKSNQVPQLHRLRKYVQALPDNEFFILLPEQPASTAEQLHYEEIVHELNHPQEAGRSDGIQALFGRLLERYDMDSPRMDKRVVIGTQDPDLKVCRFCRKSKLKGVTFKTEAHAIPTAFGNDTLILAEECDGCNSYFGREIEPSLIAFLDLHLAYLGTKGRGKYDGRPELQFTQGKIFHDGEKLNIQTTDVVVDHGDGHLAVNLGARRASLKPVAVYKALVKMALSIVDESELPVLEKTRLWLRYDEHSDVPLPQIATALINLPTGPSAVMTLYRRKDVTSALPHIVGQFQLGPYMIVFAIPFSQRDTGNLVGFFDTQEFRETFKHYDMAGQWTFVDLSSEAEVTLAPTLVFKPRSL